MTRFAPPTVAPTREPSSRESSRAPAVAALRDAWTSFSVHEPRGEERPLVVEIPHAGLMVDPASLATMVAPARALGRDADLYVDELFADAPAEGATVIVSHVSRYVCDLNRAVTDVDARTVEGGAWSSAPHGLVWRSTTDGHPAIASPLTRREFDRRLRELYHPYHDALLSLLRRKRECFGYVILLSAHSMPSRGRGGAAADVHAARADVVPGSRGRTTAAEEVIDVTADLAHARGWSVAHDEPYRGGHTTGLHGRPHDGFHAIQVELARRLYMDELTLGRKPEAFERAREYCRALVRALARVEIG